MRKLVLAGLLGACHSSVVVGDLEDVTTLRAVMNRDLDILFVVDNSPSMWEQQASLAANFPRMMDVLEQLDGGLPNVHIGVTTSDVGTTATNGTAAPQIGSIGNGGCIDAGDNGALQTSDALAGAPFISDIALPDGSRARNYTGALRDVFGEIAQVGAMGCGFEQHLHAMSRAFTNPANAGFLRPSANLAVVIVADEDDCSVADAALLAPGDNGPVGPLTSFRCTRFGVTCDPDDMTTPGVKTDCAPRTIAPLVSDIQPFIYQLLEIKGGDPRAVMVSGIVGPPEPFEVGILPITGQSQLALLPSCVFAGSAGPEEAAPAVRLAAFLDAFPGRSQLTSICNADLSTALTQIGASAKKLVGDPCLDAPNLADASPEPGLQPACEVFDVRDSAPDAKVPLAACGAGGADCFEIMADPKACPSAPGNLRVRFQRTRTPADDTWTHVRCQRAD